MQKIILLLVVSVIGFGFTTAKEYKKNIDEVTALAEKATELNKECRCLIALFYLEQSLGKLKSIEKSLQVIHDAEKKVETKEYWEREIIIVKGRIIAIETLIDRQNRLLQVVEELGFKEFLK